ncbi:hypothetical protein D9M68_875280 [compost metagenome]
MGFDAAIELVDVIEVVMRRAQGIVAQNGEEAGFFGVLLQNREQSLHEPSCIRGNEPSRAGYARPGHSVESGKVPFA